jgi:hypothetical protein
LTTPRAAKRRQRGNFTPGVVANSRKFSQIATTPGVKLR